MLIDFVREARFEWMGAFLYSREEGTVAARMRPAVRKPVARARLRELMEIQRSITRENLARWVGRTVDVLVERVFPHLPGEAEGRTPFQAPEVDGRVQIRGEELRSGEILPVRITEAGDYDLAGETASPRAGAGSRRRRASRGG
jgi:ribosomal protein S12 methylthiotransferase